MAKAPTIEDYGKEYPYRCWPRDETDAMRAKTARLAAQNRSAELPARLQTLDYQLQKLREKVEKITTSDLRKDG